MGVSLIATDRFTYALCDAHHSIHTAKPASSARSWSLRKAACWQLSQGYCVLDTVGGRPAERMDGDGYARR
jgi:hypothetical protein